MRARDRQRDVSSPAERAEVLRVVLTLSGGVPVLEPMEAAALGGARIAENDLRTMATQQEDDLALANACLVVEHELREEAFATAERLLALASGREGTLTERVLALPRREQAAALLCLYDLGWIYD